MHRGGGADLAGTPLRAARDPGNQHESRRLLRGPSLATLQPPFAGSAWPSASPGTSPGTS